MKTLSRVEQKKQAMGIKKLILLFGLTVMLASCNDVSKETEADFDAQDSEAALLDAVESESADDANDIAMDFMATDDVNSGGKIETDARLVCAVITRSGDKSSGTITIDFGSGCTDPRGNVRRGKIVIDYTGLRNVPGSNWVLRFVNFYFNDKLVEGTRTVTNISESETGVQVFTVVLEDGTITWPDGSIGRRRLHHRREEERDQNHLLNRLIIYGTCEGNHHNGRGFYIEILEPLVYDRTCADEGVFLPVKGKKLIIHGERQITVDYGDGTCDNTVTITNKNGRSWEYTVKK